MDNGPKQKKKKRTGGSPGGSPGREEEVGSESGSAQKRELSPARAVVKDVTYRQLRPEVKTTLEKIVYQLELVGKTLQMLETRIIDSEDKL